ncbi:MAG: protein translocase subunit SecD [Armatimonadota bacterium]
MPVVVRNRLFILGGLVVVAFLMVFQPIRRVPGQRKRTVEDTFLIETKTPLYQPGADRGRAAESLREEIDLEPARRAFQAQHDVDPLTLKEGDPKYEEWQKFKQSGKVERNWVDSVTFEGPRRARVVTLPLSQRQSEQYLKDTLTVIRRKHPEARRLYEGEAFFDFDEPLFATAEQREAARQSLEKELKAAGPAGLDWLTRVTLIHPKRVRISMAAPSRKQLSELVSTASRALAQAYPGMVQIARPDVQTLLLFEFPEPVAPDEKARMQREVRAVLVNANPAEGDWLGAVVFETAMRVRIRTKATTWGDADRYRDIIRQALNAEYPEIREIAEALPAHKEAPLAKFWIFEVYRPRPHINLGLDLRGGSHLVLQCLPSTTYSFLSPEDRPMLAEGEIGRALEEKILKHLESNPARYGTDFTVKVIDPRRVEVSLRTRTKAAAETRGKYLEAYFKDTFGATLESKDELLLADDTAQKVKDIIERRINYLGVAESTIEIRGKDRLIVEIPQSDKADDLKQLLNTPALLEFLLVPENVQVEYHSTTGKIRGFHDKDTGAPLTNDQVVALARAELDRLPEAQKRKRTFKGRDLLPKCRVVPDDKAPGAWAVTFELKDKENRKEQFHNFTRANVGRQLAILLDGHIEMAPVIETALPGGGRITGHFDLDKARELKLLLNAGALPVPVEVVEDRTVSATLGKDSIDKSVKAAILGVCLVVVFMVMYYRVPGFIANIALAIYVLLVLAVYTVIGATLTLPGIAAFILSIGMAVDANVIIFERLKEELHTQKSMQSAVETGFTRAWTAILDANVTTLIVALVLYYLGTSFIRGFAVTLFIGVCCSLFTAVTVTRWLVTWAIESRLGQRKALFSAGFGRIEQAAPQRVTQ